ncbi:ABC transporter permease [Pseudarthrobacter sp. N5]|uniref:ABC transporter permease n=1 Tax=Pseudarthrobacter sp. N5 TaxID=3418416 RepID=UPI003CF41B75
MSTSTLAPKRARNGRADNPGAGPTFFRVLNSEFIKFRTLTSTLILVGSTALVMVGFGALAAWGIGQLIHDSQGNPRAGAALAAQGGDPLAAIPTSGISFAQLIIGSLAVLLMSSEFTTGMARSTFAAVPKRLPAFFAKLVVIVVFAFVVTTAAALLAAAVSGPILGQYDLKLDLRTEHSLRLLFVSGLYVAAVAAIGLSLGAIIRNSAGGIMALVGLFFVLPIAFQLIPGDFFVQTRKYLPDNLYQTVTAATHADGSLEIWQASLWLGAWVLVPLVIAAVLLKKRDV